MVLRDGVLVGFVPQIPDSDDLDAQAIAAIIAGTDYDAPPPATPANPTNGPVGSRLPSPSPVAKARWRARFRRR
jgi:hypothetical protein